MPLKEFVSWISVTSTIALYCTGIFVCKKILKNGSTNESSFFPFLVMFCSSTLWMKYGLLKGDDVLIFVNSVGTLLTFSYIIVFYAYTSHKRLMHLQLLFGCALTLPPLACVRLYAVDRDVTLHRLGLVCVSVTVLSYGSPLFCVMEVLRSKSTACMTFSLSFANLIVSLEWFSYGLLAQDFFIQFPNLVGAVLSCLQLSLFCKYPQHRERVVSVAAPIGIT